MNEIITQAITYVENKFKNEFSGHDASHTMRVYKLATTLAKEENANVFIVQLAALLHDVDDYKLSKETYLTKQNARDFMKGQQIEQDTIEQVCHIIDQVSFKGSESNTPDSIEGMCVQDADRLDAIGAIGIARCLTFGGNRNRVLYDPNIKPLLNMDEDTYRNHVSTTMNHFYEKLFLLKDMMNTESGKRLAIHRHQVMEDFVEEFLKEWEGEL